MTIYEMKKSSSSHLTAEGASTRVLEHIEADAALTTCGGVAGQTAYYFVPVETP